MKEIKEIDLDSYRGYYVDGKLVYYGEYDDTVAIVESITGIKIQEHELTEEQERILYTSDKLPETI
jgi:hypothetical protein